MTSFLDKHTLPHPSHRDEHHFTALRSLRRRRSDIDLEWSPPTSSSSLSHDILAVRPLILQPLYSSQDRASMANAIDELHSLISLATVLATCNTDTELLSRFSWQSGYKDAAGARGRYELEDDDVDDEDEDEEAAHTPQQAFTNSTLCTCSRQPITYVRPTLIAGTSSPSTNEVVQKLAPRPGMHRRRSSDLSQSTDQSSVDSHLQRWNTVWQNDMFYEQSATASSSCSPLSSAPTSPRAEKSKVELQSVAQESYWSDDSDDDDDDDDASISLDDGPVGDHAKRHSSQLVADVVKACIGSPFFVRRHAPTPQLPRRSSSLPWSSRRPLSLRRLRAGPPPTSTDSYFTADAVTAHPSSSSLPSTPPPVQHGRPTSTLRRCRASSQLRAATTPPPSSTPERMIRCRPYTFL